MIEKRFTVGDELLSQEHKCCICGKKHNLEPHHIVHTTKYDELYNSIENVVIMCHDCHHEYHQRYNHELGFKTLLKFKGEYLKDYCPKLKKQNEKFKKENKLLRKTIKKLKGAME